MQRGPPPSVVSTGLALPGTNLEDGVEVADGHHIPEQSSDRTRTCLPDITLQCSPVTNCRCAIGCPRDGQPQKQIMMGGRVLWLPAARMKPGDLPFYHDHTLEHLPQRALQYRAASDWAQPLPDTHHLPRFLSSVPTVRTLARNQPNELQAQSIDNAGPRLVSQRARRSLPWLETPPRNDAHCRPVHTKTANCWPPLCKIQPATAVTATRAVNT